MEDVIALLSAALADSYQIVRELGQGGMATVYLADDLKHGRKVAVKVLRPELARVLGPERFLNEIQTAAKLNHPHILPLLDSGEADGFLYYVMPVVEGDSLRHHLTRERQLPIDRAIALTIQVAGALDYANRQGVIHRDIKPENILLHAGEAMVTDFGIALAVSEAGGERLTGTGLSLGTPDYMSPEQAAGERVIDARSDVYALGCVLFEMLAGEPPFTGPNAQSVIAKRLSQPAPSVETLRDGVPESVVATVAQCLARAPVDRFATAQEVARALEQPSIGTLGAQIRHRPALTALAFGGVAAAGLLIVYALMIRLGLPDWVFLSAATLMAIGLPIVLTTAWSERRRRMSSYADAGVTRWLTWRNAVAGGLLAFAGLGTATALFAALRGLGIGGFGTLASTGVLAKRDGILIGDFTNTTPDTLLGQTIAMLLRTDFGQSEFIRVLPPDAITETLLRMGLEPETPVVGAVSRELAEREGLKAFISGDVAPLGPAYVMTARVISTRTGEDLLTERVSARSETQLIEAVNRLSGRLRERMGESLRFVRASVPLDRVTTPSLDALRAYNAASRLPIGRQWFPQTIRLLEQAVALDSTFAMAWRRLAAAYQNNGDIHAGVNAADKAFQFSEGLPLRERLNIETMYVARILGDLDRTTALLERTLALYPDDYVALYNLANGQSGYGWSDYDSAVTLFARANDVRPSADVLSRQIDPLILGNRLDEAEQTARRVIDLYPDYPQGQNQLGFALSDIAYIRGDLDGALQHLPDDGWVPTAKMVWILQLQGRIAEVESHFRRLQATLHDTNPPQFLRNAVWMALGDIVGSNDTAGARQRMTAALDKVPLDSIRGFRRPYLEIARVYAALGEPDSARQLYEAFIADEDVPPGYKRRRQTIDADYPWTDAMLTALDGKPDLAIPKADRAFQMDRCLGPLATLGDALERANRLDSAYTVYESFLTSTERSPDCRQAPDAIWRPHVLRRIGELALERSDTTSAIEYLNAFVELWRNADPELQPQVAVVQRQLAELVGERGRRN